MYDATALTTPASAKGPHFRAVYDPLTSTFMLNLATNQAELQDTKPQAFRFKGLFPALRHQSLPIRIELGQGLEETNVISGVVTGSADSRTGEVFHLDDDVTKQVVERTSSIEHSLPGTYCTAVNPYYYCA